MNYIVIENFNDNMNIITDEEGDTVIFDSLYDAEIERDKQCQNGVIVPLTNLIGMLQESYVFLTIQDHIESRNLRNKLKQILNLS